MRARHWRRSGSIWLVVLCIALGAPASSFGQTHTLALEVDHFVVDGQARMLLMISYFDGIREYDWSPSEVANDFSYLRARRIDGVRVFPNFWDYSPDYATASYSSGTLFDSNGAFRPGRLDALKGFLNTANTAGIVVDLSLRARR